MENQHRKISGYRDLTEQEIDVINQIKTHGEQVQTLIETIDQVVDRDARWLAIAKTDLQKGFMALVRSVAKPEGF